MCIPYDTFFQSSNYWCRDFQNHLFPSSKLGPNDVYQLCVERKFQGHHCWKYSTLTKGSQTLCEANVLSVSEGWEFVYMVAAKDKAKDKKNNTRDSNVVPHRSTNLARSCLTSLSRREAVLSWLYGRSWRWWHHCCITSRCLLRKYCIQVWHAWSKLCLFFFSLRFVVLVDAYWNIRGQCVIIWNNCKKYRNTCGEVTCTIF